MFQGKPRNTTLGDCREAIIFQMSKGNIGTPLGDEIYFIYNTLKSELLNPDEAMDKVSLAISKHSSSNNLVE